MIRFGEEFVIKAICFAMIHGLLMGVFTLGFSYFIDLFRVFYNLKHAIFSPKETFKSTLNNSNVLPRIKSKVLIFFKDYVCAFVYGLSTIMLLYSATNGVVRLYPILISLCFYVLFKKYPGKAFDFLLNMLFCMIYKALAVAFYLFFYPLRYLKIPLKKLKNLFLSRVKLRKRKINRCIPEKIIKRSSPIYIYDKEKNKLKLVRKNVE